jgi:DNA-binding transcriptional ArsR family regulator
VTGTLAAAPLARFSMPSATLTGCASSSGFAMAGRDSTSKVTQVLSVTRQAATKHLGLLETAGLVSSSRRGRERIWTLQTKPLTQASDHLTQLSRRWDAAIGRLRAYVED